VIVSFVHTTFVDRTVIERDTVSNPNHAAFSGGTGGVQHQASAQELVAAHDRHLAPTRFQTAHVAEAKADKTSFAKANGGYPKKLVAAKPLAAKTHAAPPGMRAEAKAPIKVEPKAVCHRSKQELSRSLILKAANMCKSRPGSLRRNTKMFQ